MNKTILITGGSSGIGYQAVVKMLNQGNKVIAPCRDVNRANETLEKLKIDTYIDIELDKQIKLPVLDLSSFKSIELFLHKINLEEIIIDTLILNAGLQYTGSKKPKWSSDGFELTFAVNHLANQYLIQGLLQLLYQSCFPRIIITSSEVHNPKSPGGKIGETANLGDLKGLRSGKCFEMIDGGQFNADKAYKDSKLCNVLFGIELSKKLESLSRKIPVIVWAPGLVIPKSKSDFFRYSRKYNEIGQLIFAFIARDILDITETTERAGEILFELALDTKYENAMFIFKTNRVLGPGKRVFEESEISEEACNDQLAKDLWLFSSALINTNPDIK